MNWGAPSVWGLIIELITIVGMIVGWVVMYGKHREQWGKIRQEVDTNTTRLCKMDEATKKALEDSGRLVTWDAHEIRCEANFDRFEKTLDLKLNLLKSDLLLAINKK